MGKMAKVRKVLVAGLLAVTMLVTTQTGETLKAEAAQFNGDSFGVGFAGEEYATMHKADGWSNGGMFNCTWRADNIWFDGYLNLKIDRDYATGGYSGGEYRTNDTFGYGMYDVSMKPIKNDGVVTSFFTYTGPTDGTVWDEIDIEFLGKDTTKVQFNYYTNGVGNHEYVYDLGFDASQSFHQYGFLWQPGKITWYVDGKAVYSATQNIPTTPGKIMLNVWPGTGVDSWLKPYNGRTPLVAQYDWINWKKVDGISNNNTSNNNTSNNNNNNWNNNNNNNSNTGATVGSNFTIEAENYTYMSGVEKAGNCVGYIDPGDWMSYEVNVANAGTYSVEFRVASAQGSSFRLEKNSGTEVLANVNVPNTGDWGAYKSVYADVYLTAGKNNLAIATDRGGFNLDKMVFTAKSGGNTNNNTSNNNTNNNWNNNNNNWNNNWNNNTNNNTSNNNTSGAATFTVEAENFNYMSGVEKAGTCVGYIDPGDWMSYEVNVASAGTYSVEFRVASAQGSSFRLEKNSGTELLANVNVPNTGDWGAYRSVYADVYLTAGKNNIAIATDRGGFNIDKMVFTKK